MQLLFCPGTALPSWPSRGLIPLTPNLPVQGAETHRHLPGRCSSRSIVGPAQDSLPANSLEPGKSLCFQSSRTKGRFQLRVCVCLIIGELLWQLERGCVFLDRLPVSLGEGKLRHRLSFSGQPKWRACKQSQF